jgi:hypothetical protein
MEMLPDGEEPKPADRYLFEMLLADDGADLSSTDSEGQHGPGDAQRSTPRSDLRDVVTCVSQGHDGAARQKQHNAEMAAGVPLDMAALSSVVSKVYLESDLNRQRAVHMALNDDMLPATRLSIFEQGGRLAVDFVSMNMTTRQRLRRGAYGLAQRIAADLTRDVSVRVAAYDNDRRALEARADAALAVHAREAK